MKKILTYPNKALSTDWTDPQWSISEGELGNASLHMLVDCLIDEMYMRKAVGFAANQIGEPADIFVLDVDGDPLVVINPVVRCLGEVIEMEEACLSLPGVSAKVPRSKYVRLIYHTMDYELRTDFFEGIQAQAIQHEVDHLTGKLYWDHLSSMKRDMLKRKYTKIHKYK